MAETRQQDISRLAKLQELAGKDNLVGVLPDEEVEHIGIKVIELAEMDDNSRAEWKDKSEKAMELALQVVEEKTNPWPGASNIKYPLITTAALQFHARAYPAVIPGAKVVKAHVTGRDDTGEKFAAAERIAAHMNWQILEEDEEWEANMDRLLLAMAIEGCEFKKTYFSKDKGHNVSEWVRPENLIVHNKTRSLETCPRITQPIYYYPHEIDERMRNGVWVEEELSISSDEIEEEVLQEFYEQHFFWDLDGDGYKEPCIAVVHVDSRKPVRIFAGYHADDIEIELKGKRGRLGDMLLSAGQMGVDQTQVEDLLDQAKVMKVPRIAMFTKYGLIPSPDGSFYDLGFGQLIGPLSDSIDTTLNQLMDAGTLSNMQGGFVADGVNINSNRGDLEWERGKFKRITLPAGKGINDSIYQMKFHEPSVVLFNLLGTLIQAAKDVTSVQDIMSGATPADNREAATTTMIRIEQGLKVFNSIYKRIHRSLKNEFRTMFRLNAIYLEPEAYFRVLDTGEQGKVELTDYQGDGTDVQPVADPQLATNVMAMAKNQALLGIMQHPLVDDEEVLRRYFEGLDIPSPEKLVIPAEQRQPQPDPEMVLKTQVAASEHAERQVKMANMIADTIKKLAEAEAEEKGPQMQLYMKQLDMLQGIVNGQGKSPQLEAPSGNQGSNANAPGQAAGIVPGNDPGVGQL